MSHESMLENSPYPWITQRLGRTRGTMAKPFFFLIIILVPLAKSLAGDVFRVEASSGITIMESSQSLLSHWNNGWTAGMGVGYPLSASCEIGASLFYHRFPFGNNLSLAFPAVWGFRWRVDGKATNMYEAAVEVRFTLPTSFLRPFLSVRGGVCATTVGQVLVTTWMETSPQNTSSSVYRGTGESLTRGFGGAGLGFRMPLYSNLQFGVEGRCTAAFDGSYTFWPVLGTIQLLL